jgi:chromosome segregation ATPase
MDNKNHEQYLVEIENAVAETTQQLINSVVFSNKEEYYKKLAEKETEICRLKSHQLGNNKKVKNLRNLLATATEEIKLYQEELNIATDEYDKLKKENEKLKEENEKLNTKNLTRAGMVVGNWFRLGYDSFEDAIIGEFGSRSAYDEEKRKGTWLC